MSMSIPRRSVCIRRTSASIVLLQIHGVKISERRTCTAESQKFADVPSSLLPHLEYPLSVPVHRDLFRGTIRLWQSRCCHPDNIPVYSISDSPSNHPVQFRIDQYAIQILHSCLRRLQWVTLSQGFLFRRKYQLIHYILVAAFVSAAPVPILVAPALEAREIVRIIKLLHRKAS